MKSEGILFGGFYFWRWNLMYPRLASVFICNQRWSEHHLFLINTSHALGGQTCTTKPLWKLLFSLDKKGLRKVDKSSLAALT